MILISKEIYSDMVESGFIKHGKYNKNVAKTKNKYYVVEPDYYNYKKSKSKNKGCA